MLSTIVAPSEPPDEALGRFAWIYALPRNYEWWIAYASEPKRVDEHDDR